VWSSAESQQPNDSSPSDAKKKVAAQAARLSWGATGPSNPHQKQPPCSETHRSPRPLASVPRGITPLATRFIYLALTSPPPADDKQVMVCVQHGDTLADQNAFTTGECSAYFPSPFIDANTGGIFRQCVHYITTASEPPTSHRSKATARIPTTFGRPFDVSLTIFRLSKDDSDAFLGGFPKPE